MVINNKKGFFFTFIIIIVLSMLLFSSAFYIDLRYRESIQKRVSTMNNYLVSTEKDLERQIYVTGYRIIVLFEEKIITDENYVPNANSLFEEAFFNGTINQQSQSLLNKATFYELLNNTYQNADRIGVKLNISNPTINLTQEDPWHIAIVLTANLTMSDKSNLAHWNKTLIIKSYIPIERFEDPLYLLNTGGKVPIKPKKTPYIFSSTDLTNLSLHLQNSYYIASNESSSFLDRLKGNTNAQSQFGIESLVNLNNLYNEGISVENRPIIDHIYFSDLPISLASTCSVESPMPASSMFMNDHITLYNLTGKCT